MSTPPAPLVVRHLESSKIPQQWRERIDEAHNDIYTSAAPSGMAVLLEAAGSDDEAVNIASIERIVPRPTMCNYGAYVC